MLRVGSFTVWQSVFLQNAVGLNVVAPSGVPSSVEFAKKGPFEKYPKEVEMKFGRNVFIFCQKFPILGTCSQHFISFVACEWAQ
jgi:hypothetical protein